MASLFMVVEMTRSRHESVPDHLIAFLREMHNSRTRLRLVLHPGSWLQWKEDNMEETRIAEWFQDLLDADHVKSESLTAKQDRCCWPRQQCATVQRSSPAWEKVVKTMAMIGCNYRNRCCTHLIRAASKLFRNLAIDMFLENHWTNQ